VEGVGEDVEAEGEADPTVEVTQPARKNGAITSKRGSGDGQVLNDERRNRCDEQEPGKVVEHHGDLRVSIRAEARDGHDQHRNEEKHGRHRAGEDLDEGQDGCTSFCAPHRIRQDRLRGDHQADPDRGQSDAEWNARPVAIELDNLVGGVARTQREGKDAGNQPASDGDGDGRGSTPGADQDHSASGSGESQGISRAQCRRNLLDQGMCHGSLLGRSREVLELNRFESFSN